MNDAQPYLNHRMPAVMGLNSWKMEEFMDLVIMANDEQLEAMKRYIIKEMDGRDKR